MGVSKLVRKECHQKCFTITWIYLFLWCILNKRRMRFCKTRIGLKEGVIVNPCCCSLLAPCVEENIMVSVWPEVGGVMVLVMKVTRIKIVQYLGIKGGRPIKLFLGVGSQCSQVSIGSKFSKWVVSRVTFLCGYLHVFKLYFDSDIVWYFVALYARHWICL